MKGLVIKSTGSWYNVELESGERKECRIKGLFRIKGQKNTNPLAVGDWVEVEEGQDGDSIISELYPRNNYIVRKSVNLSRQLHIIAANLDQCYLFITLKQPETPLGFIDRFLVSAETFRIPVTLLFNKSDIYDQDELAVIKALMKEYEKIGYPSILHSSTAGDKFDITALHGKTTLLAGNSGAGKSTFINLLNSELDLKTASISDYHEKGMHTTTFAEMFKIADKTWVIDTPGIKGFGVVDIEKQELAHYFPEMRSRMSECKFNNCRHIDEPGCAIKQAVESGEIWENRYDNYLSIYHDNENETYRGAGY